MTRTAIISVDGHVKAPLLGYREYIEARLRERFDEYVKSMEDAGTAEVSNVGFDYDRESQWDTSARWAALEAKGVAAEVLFPNGVPFQINQFDDHARAEDRELARAGRLAYNRWLADFCSESPGRRSGQAFVSFDDIDQGVRDVAWAKEHGLGGIMLPIPSPRMFFDPALDPIWAACRDLDMTITQHGGIGDVYEPAGFAAIMTIAIESGFYSNRSLWQLIVGGVFDRFPELRVAFIETQLMFLVPAIRKLDEEFTQGTELLSFAALLGRERAFERSAAEYFASNCFVGVSPFSPRQIPLDELVGKGADQQPLPGFHVGADNAMFGVDYPHFESIYRTTTDEVAGLVEHPSVSVDDAQKILFDNALDVFRFNREELAPHVERVGFDLNDVRLSLHT
jgi:predicted TIM-barrel fold metal-dependent hydrolase